MDKKSQNGRSLQERIKALSPDSTLHEVRELANAVFRVHFGVSSGVKRLRDIKGEVFEFLRASSRAHRVEEFGDYLASSLVYAAEENVDIAAAIRKTLEKIEGRADLYAEHGDKPNVSIFGGSFDPPHQGHVAAIKALLASKLDIREVWVMPAFRSMSSKRLTPARHRAAMCRLLRAIDPRIKYFSYEIDRKLSSETLHTLTCLQAEPFADRHRIHFVVSIDVANAIPNWADADELMRSAIFLTLPRPGYEPNLRNPWFIQEPHHYLADAQGLLEVSSTAIRDAYRRNDRNTVATLVTPAVDEYIRKHQLYGAHE